MAHLSFTVGGQHRELVLANDDVTIGRSSLCALRLTHDSEISRIHCSLQRDHEGRYVVVDAASRNGTFLNGVRVANDEAPLQDGDEIRVGKTVIRFIESDLKRTAEAMADIAQQLEGGKGYQTLFREIVGDK